MDWGAKNKSEWGSRWKKIGEKKKGEGCNVYLMKEFEVAATPTLIN